MPVESHPIFQRYVAGKHVSDRFFLTSQNGSRAILYQDSTLRWCHVSDDGYSFMQLEPLLGEVNNAILSNSGDFLCLYNDCELRIIEVPWGYDDVSSIAKAFQKFHYSVGSNDSKIKQVLYHPLAYEEDSIVVLKHDDSIGILNWKDGKLSQDILNQYNKAFGVDTLIGEIESISFSTDGLTLYALSISEGGDIYAFYPCLPSRVSMAKEKLDLLVHKSLIQYDGLKVETPAEAKRNSIKQMQFVSRLRKISSESENAALGNYTQLDIPFEHREVRGQGPFTIVPFPDRFYSCTCKEMAVLPIDENNELIIMTFDDGTIAILFKDLEMIMNWDSNAYSYNNSLVLIETIKLDVKDIGKLVISSNFGQFFILGNKSTHVIDTTKWTTIMSTCINTSDLRPLGELKIESEVISVDYNGNFNSVASWNCPEESSYVYVSSNNHVVTKSTVATENQKDNNAKEVETGSKPSTFTHRVKFSQPMAEIIALNQSFQRETATPLSKLIKPQQRQAPLANDSNEEQLDILTGISKEFLGKIAKGQSLGLMLHNRIVEQQLELTRQLKFSCHIMEKQALLLDHDPQCSKVDANVSRQNVLASRLNKLNDTLYKINTSAKFRKLDINNKEMEWFKEIRDQILTFNQFVHNQKTLQEQTFYLKKELNRIANETANVHEKTQDDWEELRKMLKDDIKIIKDCSSQLIRASSDIDTRTSA